MRLSRSSAVTLRSTYSPILLSVSRSCLATSLDEVLIDLQDLQLGLGDLALGLRGRGDELATLALQPRFLALQRGQTIDLNQVLLPQILYALQFLLDQRDFLVLGVLLRLQAGDLLVELSDTLLQLVLLAEPRLAPQIEQLALAC